MRRLGGSEPFQGKGCAGRRICAGPGVLRWLIRTPGLGGGAPDKAGAEVELYRDGTFEVRTSSAELGQGLPTVLR